MNRRSLVIVAFSICVIGIPFWVSSFGARENLATAQDEDLIVVQPPDELADPDGSGRPQESKDLIVHPPLDDLDLADPKQVYLELVKQKIQLLTPDELAQETEKLRQELVELNASHKLLNAERQLQRIIDEHPESVAANRARLMLDSARGQNFNRRDPNQSRFDSPFESEKKPLRSRTFSPDDDDSDGEVVNPRGRLRERRVPNPE